MGIFNQTTKIENDSTDREPDRWNTIDAPAADVIFGVLRNERRRRVLRYLDAADGDVEINELAVALAKQESDDGTYDHRDRKRTYIALHQSHLPKMHEFGIVEYDNQSKRVRLGTEFEYVEPYLYDRLETSVGWDRMYFAAGLVGVGVVGPGYLWSLTMGSMSEWFWAGMLVGICASLIIAYLVFSTEWMDTEWIRA